MAHGWERRTILFQTTPAELRQIADVLEYWWGRALPGQVVPGEARILYEGPNEILEVNFICDEERMPPR